MAGLESHLAAQKSVNVPELDYSGGNQAPLASYITNRTRSQTFAQGANIFNLARGQKLIRFSLTSTVNGGAFLDASSIRFRATINNNDDTNPLQFLGPD